MKVAGHVWTLAVPSIRQSQHRLPASRPGHNVGGIHLERVTTQAALPPRSIEELEVSTPESSTALLDWSRWQGDERNRANSILPGSKRVQQRCCTRLLTCRQDWAMLVIQTTSAQASVLPLHLPPAPPAVPGSDRARSTDTPQETRADGVHLGYKARGSGPG
jgi:hypothetical protein